MTSEIGEPTWQNHHVSDDPVHEAFSRAADDRVHGAAEIEKRLISDLLFLRPSWTPEKLAMGAAHLTAAQPAMAALVGLADRIASGEADDVQRWLEQRLEALKLAPEALAAGAEPWIERAAVVVSISRSSAVAAVLEGAWRKGWAGTAAVLDGSSAGGGEGQAAALARSGTAVSQPDAAAPHWLDLPGCLVVVGADAVAPAEFLNCIGTRALLELATARKVPVLLVADRGKDVPEEALMALTEVIPRHREGSVREWPIFEVVPMDLVTARISD